MERNNWRRERKKVFHSIHRSSLLDWRVSWDLESEGDRLVIPTALFRVHYSSALAQFVHYCAWRWLFHSRYSSIRWSRRRQFGRDGSAIIGTSCCTAQANRHLAAHSIPKIYRKLWLLMPGNPFRRRQKAQSPQHNP